MKKYDLHVHTYYSDRSNEKPEKILKFAHRKKLDGIAIVDHETIKGALEVKKLNNDKNFEVIIGEEFYTEKGHVLGYFLKKEIPHGSFEEVVKQIKKQGGLAVIAHPFDVIRGMKNTPAVKMLDAVEVLNGRTSTPMSNKRARGLAQKYSKGMTAGSDAHFFFEIGKVRAVFEGDIKKSILNGSIKAEGWGLQNPLGELLSMFTIIFKRLSRLNRIKH